MKQSPLLAAYSAQAFELGAVNDMNIALRAKVNGSRGDWVADLSAIRRRLIVGRAAPAWLAEHDIVAPRGLLEARELAAGALIVRLHRHQYLLIDSVDEAGFDAVFSLEDGRHGDVLVLPYEAVEIACGGPHVEALVAELCALDVSAAGRGTWIATRLAHCELALRHNEAPAHYRFTCSAADARFLFGVLCEFTLERGGAILGFDDYRASLERGD